MLSKDEYSALKEFSDTPIELPNHSEVIDSLIDQVFIAAYGFDSELIEHGELTQVVVVPKTWCITLEGKKALLNFEEVSRQKSEAKRQKRRDRGFEIFLVLLAFLLGIVSQRYSDIISFISKLFR